MTTDTSSGYKLGKTDPTPKDTDFQLKALETLGQPLPPAPARFGHGYAFKDWHMFANDQYGDCVEADAAHATMLVNKLARKQVTIADENVLADYSSITGFNPNDPSTDQGTNMGEALSFRRHTGTLDAAGNRHKIGAYISIDPTDFDKIVQATYVFTVVSWGFQFPLTAFQQFDEHEPWDPVDMDGSTIAGGHDVPIVGRASTDVITCVTWGRKQTLTRRFVREYGDECYAIVFPEELRNGHTYRGYVISQLREWLGKLN
jgi:hypothetical protein